MIDNIIWMPVKGYESQYLINTAGEVKSIAKTIIKGGRKRTITETTISQRIDRSGYPSVSLKKSGKSSTQCVHKLLAEAFIPNPENKGCINHKNGIKTDYRLENLEWCTQSENMKHAYKMGLSTVPEPFRKKVVDSCSGLVYNSIQQAATALGIHYKTCQHYLHGRLTNPTCLQFAA